MRFGPVWLLLIASKLTFKVLSEYERGMIFQLSWIARGLDPGHDAGHVIIVPFIDRLVHVSPRVVAMDLPH